VKGGCSSLFHQILLLRPQSKVSVLGEALIKISAHDSAWNFGADPR